MLVKLDFHSAHLASILWSNKSSLLANIDHGQANTSIISWMIWMPTLVLLVSMGVMSSTGAIFLTLSKEECMCTKSKTFMHLDMKKLQVDILCDTIPTPWIVRFFYFFHDFPLFLYVPKAHQSPLIPSLIHLHNNLCLILATYNQYRYHVT